MKQVMQIAFCICSSFPWFHWTSFISCVLSLSVCLFTEKAMKVTVQVHLITSSEAIKNWVWTSVKILKIPAHLVHEIWLLHKLQKWPGNALWYVLAWLGWCWTPPGEIPSTGSGREIPDFFLSISYSGQFGDTVFLYSLLEDIYMVDRALLCSN